jgi:hypothetical protein
MIWVLSDDDHLHLVKGTQVESIEDEFPRGETNACSILLPDGTCQLLEIRFLELPLQMFLPRGLNLHI